MLNDHINSDRVSNGFRQSGILAFRAGNIDFVSFSAIVMTGVYLTYRNIVENNCAQLTINISFVPLTFPPVSATMNMQLQSTLHKKYFGAFQFFIILVEHIQTEREKQS